LPVSHSQTLVTINRGGLNQSNKNDGLQTGQFSLQEGDYVITVTSEKE